MGFCENDSETYRIASCCVSSLNNKNVMLMDLFLLRTVIKLQGL
jgi:hypothetical protein